MDYTFNLYFMITIFICLHFLLISVSRTELPLTICSGVHPFKTKENTCANFLEICVKKDDPECDAFQSACKQCPPQNYSILGFLEVMNLKNYSFKQLPILENITNDLKEEFKLFRGNIDNRIREMKNDHDATDRRTLFLLIFIIFIFLLFFTIMVAENRFKLFTKMKERCCKEGNCGTYTILQSRSDNKIKDIIKSSSKETISSIKEEIDIIKSSSKETISSIKEEIENKFNKIIRLIERSPGSLKRKITFRIKGFDKTVELNISHTDCIVGIKKQICSKWSESKPHFYKIMTLKSKDKVLDNNEYLLSCLLPGEDIVDCEIDESINHEHILVLQMKGNRDIPDFVKIDKNKTVDELKQIIYKFTDKSDIVIFNEHKELNDKIVLGNYKLEDNTLLTIVKRESGKLVIRSILGEYKSIVVEYSNIDSINSIRTKISKEFDSDSENSFLFLNDEILNENKFIYEYNINNESIIKYYYLLKKTDVKKGKFIEKGYISELFEGINLKNQKGISILMYEYSIEDDKDIKTLVQYQIRKHHPSFLQFFGIYKDDTYVCEIFEYASGGTLTNYLKEHKNISDDQIRIWCKEILEYLKYIHENDTFYGNLKTYDIFVDAEGHLKMYSFAIVERYYRNNSVEKLKRMQGNINLSRAYLAPEIRRNENYDKSADVWSLGVILIRIVTGDPDLKELTYTSPEKSEILEYTFPRERPEELKKFIDLCVKFYPSKRATIDELLQHPFIQN